MNGRILVYGSAYVYKTGRSFLILLIHAWALLVRGEQREMPVSYITRFDAKVNISISVRNFRQSVFFGLGTFENG